MLYNHLHADHEEIKPSYHDVTEIAVDNVYCDDSDHSCDWLNCAEAQGATGAVHISDNRSKLSILSSKRRKQRSGKFLANSVYPYTCTVV